MTDDALSRDVGSDAVKSGGVGMILSMIRHVGSLAASVGFERSFKATVGQLARDRFLLGVDRPRNGTNLDESIERVCIALGMPPDHQEAFRHALVDANHVYFGAERDHQSVTVKAYLEFRDAVTRRIAAGHGEAQSYRLYTGYKWVPANRFHCLVSHYQWYPFLPAADIVERVGRIIDAKKHAVLGSVISRVAQRALETVPPQAVQFLEVSEDGSARASFDINIYKAGYRLGDLRPLLLEAIEDLVIPRDAFESLLQRVSGQRVGHLAAGLDRDGRYFFTVYYGGRLVDGDRLRRATLSPG